MWFRRDSPLQAEMPAQNSENPPHRRLSEIEAINSETLRISASWRAQLEQGFAHRDARKTTCTQHRYFGLFPCRAEKIDFVMMHAHDDVVVWDYLWFGEDGYEPEMIAQWVKWCKPGGLVLDIGGYSGLMSLLAARSNPKTTVHMFEPLDRQLERASVNMNRNTLRLSYTLPSHEQIREGMTRLAAVFH